VLDVFISIQFRSLRKYVFCVAGLVTSTIPMYLTEIAPLSIRGAMGVLCPLGITVGVLVAQILGLESVLGKFLIVPPIGVFSM
jgi:Sugar (and other) transporter.